MHVDPGQVEHARRSEQHPDHDQSAGAETGEQARAREAGGDDDRGGHREKRQAVDDGREAQVLLHVIRQEHEHGEHRRRGDADRQKRRAPVAVGDHAQRQQRVRRAALDLDECPE